MVQWWRDFEDFQAWPYPGGAEDQPYFVAQGIRACREARAKEESKALNG